MKSSNLEVLRSLNSKKIKLKEKEKIKKKEEIKEVDINSETKPIKVMWRMKKNK